MQLDNFVQGRGVIRKDPVTGLPPPPDVHEAAKWQQIDATIAARAEQYYGQAPGVFDNDEGDEEEGHRGSW